MSPAIKAVLRNQSIKDVSNYLNAAGGRLATWGTGSLIIWSSSNYTVLTLTYRLHSIPHYHRTQLQSLRREKICNLLEGTLGIRMKVQAVASIWKADGAEGLGLGEHLSSGGLKDVIAAGSRG